MTTVLGTPQALLNLTASFNGTYLFLGHGSKGLYADMGAVQSCLDDLAQRFDALHGESRWLTVFGGDNFVAEKPDIAHVVKYMQDRHQSPILAIQSDIVVKKWNSPVDPHVDYAHYVPTTLDDAGKVVWGGFFKGKAAGPTAVYLGDLFLAGDRPVLSGVIAAGGGPIALQEASHAVSKGIKLFYLPSETLNQDINGRYGSLHDWIMGESNPNVEILET